MTNHDLEVFMRQPDTTQPITEFKSDPGGTAQTDANAMLVGAYMAFWLLVFGFVAFSWRRQRLLAARLDRLERALPQVDTEDSRDG